MLRKQFSAFHCQNGWLEVLNELLEDSDTDLVQFSIFIKDLDEIGSMLIQFADETKVRQRLY